MSFVDSVACDASVIASAENTTIAAANTTSSIETVLTYLLLVRANLRVLDREMTSVPRSMDPTNRVGSNSLELGEPLVSIPYSNLSLEAIFYSPYSIGKAIFNLVAAIHPSHQELSANKEHCPGMAWLLEIDASLAHENGKIEV